MSKLFIVLFVCMVTCVFTSPVHARSVNLNWDASPSDSVAGYKIYYSQDEDSLPFSGTGAGEGDSPVDIGDALSGTISNLEDDAIYYFAVTAYDLEGNESTYSNVVNTGWEPVLVQPSDQTSGLTIPTYVSWESAPTGFDVSYILFYGTDQQSVENAQVLLAPPPVPPFTGNSPKIFSLFIIFALFLLLGLSHHKSSVRGLPRPSFAIALLMLGGMLITSTQWDVAEAKSTKSPNYSSVSGKVVGKGKSATNTVATDTVDSLGTDTLLSVDLGTDNFFEITELQYGTTYYWKIVAVDEINSSLEYQSAIYSFTTEN